MQAPLKPRLWFMQGHWYCNAHESQMPAARLFHGKGVTPVDAFKDWRMANMLAQAKQERRDKYYGVQTESGELRAMRNQQAFERNNRLVDTIFRAIGMGDSSRAKEQRLPKK